MCMWVSSNSKGFMGFFALEMQEDVFVIIPDILSELFITRKYVKHACI
jgi:hypothetical protein